MTLLLTGASGLIGKHLIRHLLREGHEVRALARSPEKIFELPETSVFRWSDSQVPPDEAFRGVDAIVHLAGENIADGRWTQARKERLRASRVVGTQRLLEGLARRPEGQRPRVLIAASAVGYYGDAGDASLNENSPNGQDFLAGICREWEASTDAAKSLGVRVVQMRFGIVLSREGGALEKMGPAILGTGRQWVSWVHIDDIANFVSHSLRHEHVKGPYNLVAPKPVTNRDFTKVLSAVLHYPLTVRVPSFLIRGALGEMASMVLASQKALPVRTLESGYQFRFSELRSALQDLFGDGGFLDGHLALSQFVPMRNDEIFPFFSRAENLEILTPPWLNFRIVGKSTTSVTKDTLIDYKLKVHGAPIRWRTLISTWDPESAFVDDQIRGPYKKWHHVHLFEKVPGGTLLRDEVTFRVPGSVLGKILLGPWIRKDVETIFSYRQRKIRELYQRGELR